MGSVCGIEPIGDLTYLTVPAGDKLVEVKADRDFRADLNVAVQVGFDLRRLSPFDTASGQRLR